MKKITSFVMIFALIITFILTGKVHAASLDTLTVSTSKQTVRPGEEVTLTINFGQDLGAYTFDISYDNNIFEYVSVDGGTANDTTDKVRVTFYDTTGGSSPRQNMNITFKAKSDIVTSNPTELTVIGEGLANADASVTYDDITTPIVKNITVEPEYQDYVINLTHTGDIIVGQEKDMTLSYSSSMGRFYEHARLVAEATTPYGANVKLTAIDNTRAEQDIIQSGWGDPQGYAIGGRDVSQVLNVKGLFTGVGDYTITLKLIDRDNSDSVISEKEFSFTAKEEAITPPEEESGEDIPTEPETPSKPEKIEEQKPTKLPKTGNNAYITLSIIIVSIIGLGFYINNKNHN